MKYRYSHEASRNLLFPILTAFFLLLSFSAYAQPGLLLSYKTTHDLTPRDDVQWVEVYEDGMALIHYPVYMKKAGDYSVQLSPSEVQQIRLALEHPLVQGFDRAQVREEKRAIDASSDDLFEISDNRHSEFKFSGQGRASANQRIRWNNLQLDVDRYPEIGILRRLADIETSLLELDQHPTAQRIK